MSTDPLNNASAQPGMLCVSIHDVAPATWSDCLRLVQAIRAVADIPLTWLVVPHYHFRPEHSAQMEACLDVAVDRGDELALHGYSHLDTEANGGGLRGRFLRNVYTRREGEFAALGEAEARRRLELGLDWFAERGWTPSGFVPPAWLLGEGAWRALRGSPFTYTTTFSHFHCLPGPHDSWQRAPAQRRNGRRDRRDRRSQLEHTGRSLQDDHNRSRQGEAYASNAGRPWEGAGSMGFQPRSALQGTQDRREQGAPRYDLQGRLDLDDGRLDDAARSAAAAAAAAAGAGMAAADAGAAEARYAAMRAAVAAGAEPDAADGRMVSAAGNVIAYPGRAILSPSMVYAARNRSGRFLSPRVADVTAAMLANSPLVRFSLHPPDARYPELVRHIQQVLERLLLQREAVTKAECARRLVLADGFTGTAPSHPRASSPDPNRCSHTPPQRAGDRASY